MLLRRQATPLYNERLIATAVLSDGKWMEPAPHWKHPSLLSCKNYNESLVLAPDGGGRMWLLFRHRVPRIPDVSSEAALHGAAWEVWASAYEGGRWSAPVVLPSSSGRSDMATAAAARPGGTTPGCLVVRYARLRCNDPPACRDLQRRASPARTGAAAAPDCSQREHNLRYAAFQSHPNEEQDLKRIRAYTIASGGSNYRIYRGDIHRHTEISRDGKNDGSLWDTYRYALDAASLDFLGRQRS